MQEKVLISNLPISYLSIYCTFKDFSYVEHAYISRVGTVVSWNQVPLNRDTPTEMNKTSRRYLELVRVIDFFGSFVHFVKYSGCESEGLQFTKGDYMKCENRVILCVGN